MEKFRNTTEAVRKLLSEGRTGNQDQIREELRKLGIEVTQSTISRTLNKLGAVKEQGGDRSWHYRLPTIEETLGPSSSLNSMVHNLDWNDSLVVLNTTAGSANLVARYLDSLELDEILGTMAGDDCIFIAPASGYSPAELARVIQERLQM